MRETNSIRAIEHKDVLVRPEEAVVERITEAQWRIILIEHLPRVRRELEFGLVRDVPGRALIVVRLGAKLDPTFFITEINRFVLRRVDVSGPKKADVAMIKDVLVGFALERHVNVVGSDQLESRPTFQMKGRRGRLMQFRFAL